MSSSNRDVEHDQHKGRDSQWLQLAATETGLKFLDQVKRVDQLLAAKGLFLKAAQAGGAGMICRPGWGRLTDFGIALCLFLEGGE